MLYEGEAEKGSEWKIWPELGCRCVSNARGGHRFREPRSRWLSCLRRRGSTIWRCVHTRGPMAAANLADGSRGTIFWRPIWGSAKLMRASTRTTGPTLGHRCSLSLIPKPSAPSSSYRNRRSATVSATGCKKTLLPLKEGDKVRPGPDSTRTCYGFTISSCHFSLFILFSFLFLQTAYVLLFLLQCFCLHHSLKQWWLSTINIPIL